MSTSRDRGLVEDRSSSARVRARLGRHVQWLRRDGLARLVEEDGLDPRERISSSLRAWRWRRQHKVEPGTARAVFVVGVQRSGTNMVVRGFEQDPAVEVHNENDKRTFERFQLRGDDVVRDAIRKSRHETVLFKPLCDSHRTTKIIDGLTAQGTDARAVWVYRGVDGRARSAVRKFGDVNRRVLTEIAAGRGMDRWQAQSLSPESLELIRSIGPESLDPESAAALFWLVRNRLYLELGFDQRRDIHLVCYERVVADPDSEIDALARFLGVEASPERYEHIDRRSAYVAPLDLHPQVRGACLELEAALAEIADQCHRRITGAELR